MSAEESSSNQLQEAGPSSSSLKHTLDESNIVVEDFTTADPLTGLSMIASVASILYDGLSVSGGNQPQAAARKLSAALSGSASHSSDWSDHEPETEADAFAANEPFVPSATLPRQQRLGSAGGSSTRNTLGRRLSHSASERYRREEMKKKFDRLALCLPPSMHATSKSEILQGSIAHINSLHHALHASQQTLKDLMSKKGMDYAIIEPGSDIRWRDSLAKMTVAEQVIVASQ